MLNRLGLGQDGKPLPEEPVMTDLAVSAVEEIDLGNNNNIGAGDVRRTQGGFGVEHMEQDVPDHFSSSGEPVVGVDLNKLLSAASVQNSGTAAWLGLAPPDQGSPPELLFHAGDKSEDSSITSDRYNR